MSKQPMENYFIVVPHFIMHDTTLSLADRMLYGILAGLTHREGYAWGKNEYMAETLGVSTRTIQRSLRTLEERNLIISIITFDIERNRKKRFIYLKDIFVANGGNLEKKVFPGIDTSKYKVVIIEDGLNETTTGCHVGHDSLSKNNGQDVTLYNKISNNIQDTSNTTDVDSLKTGNSNFLIEHPAVADVSSLDDLNKNINKSENKDNKSENKIKDKPDKNNINLFDINKNICIDNKIIKYWNKKNNVVKHLNHSTKLYKQTNEIINQILEGTYKPELNKPFMLDNHLKNLYKAPIEITDIMDTIDLFDKSLDADHTGDKAKSPKSLKDFFCNRNGYSTFLYLARHGITKSDAVVPSVFFNYLSPVMKKAVSKLINRRMPHASDNTLSQIYTKSLNTQKEILRLITVFKSQGGSPYTTSEKEVTKQWIAYIERLPELYPSSFDTGTIFDNFVNHVCQLHGVNDKYVVKKKHEEAHVVYNAEELYGDDDFDDLYK